VGYSRYFHGTRLGFTVGVHVAEGIQIVETRGLMITSLRQNKLLEWKRAGPKSYNNREVAKNIPERDMRITVNELD